MKESLEGLVTEMVNRGIDFEDAVDEFEKQFILTVVSRHKGNISKASSELKIHRNTLSKRMSEYANNGAAPKRPRASRAKTQTVRKRKPR